jgi:ATP-dependent DNA helicase RecG
MKPNEKNRVLTAFRENKIRILVATPVVEVGIDIPNATIMVIEASERFGLGQLHQLRGRVGRGSLSSYCLLFTESEDEKTHTRLTSLETIFSGPELAEIDLKLRGPGELLGTRQHGLPNLKIAEFTDMALIEQTNRLYDSHSLIRVFEVSLLRKKRKKSTIESVTKTNNDSITKRTTQHPKGGKRKAAIKLTLIGFSSAPIRQSDPTPGVSIMRFVRRERSD